MIKKLTFIFLMTLACASPILAQDGTATSEHRCSIAQRDDVFGEKISIDVSGTDLSSVLVAFYDLAGCVFIIDESVSRTLRVERFTAIDQPWNVVLAEFLKSQGLGVNIVWASNGASYIRVATIEEIKPRGCGRRVSFDSEPILTEFVKLKNLAPCGGDDACDQTLTDAGRMKDEVSRRLSRHGKVEFDATSRMLIITDVKPNLEAIQNLVNYLDNPEFYNQTQDDK